MTKVTYTILVSNFSRVALYYNDRLEHSTALNNTSKAIKLINVIDSNKDIITPADALLAKIYAAYVIVQSSNEFIANVNVPEVLPKHIKDSNAYFNDLVHEMSADSTELVKSLEQYTKPADLFNFINELIDHVLNAKANSEVNADDDVKDDTAKVDEVNYEVKDEVKDDINGEVKDEVTDETDKVDETDNVDETDKVDEVKDETDEVNADDDDKEETDDVKADGDVKADSEVKADDDTKDDEIVTVNAYSIKSRMKNKLNAFLDEHLLDAVKDAIANNKPFEVTKTMLTKLDAFITVE